MELKVNVKGLGRLERKLNSLGGSIAGPVEAALLSGGLVIQNEAKTRAPYRSGNMRRSIHTETILKTPQVVKVGTGTDVEYAKYVELGTGIYAVGGDGRKTPWRYKAANGVTYWTAGMRPKPFLRPAADEKRAEVAREIRAALKEAIRRQAR